MGDHVVVPAKGYVQHMTVNGAVTVFGRLGPFPFGTYLEKVDLVITNVPSADVLFFKITMGTSSEATLVGLNAGRSLINRSTTSSASQNEMIVRPNAETVNISIPVGVRVGTGPRYVIISVASTEAATISEIQAMSVSKRIIKMKKAENDEEAKEAA